MIITQSHLLYHTHLTITKVLFLSEAYWRPIRNQSDDDSSDRRPIGERHALSETHIPNRRPTCLIQDPHAWSESRDPTEIDMPLETHRRPTRLRSPIGVQSKHIYSNMLFLYALCLIFILEYCKVSNQTCRRWSNSLLGLR